MSRCPLSRQLLAGGSAALQVFLTAPQRRLPVLASWQMGRLSHTEPAGVSVFLSFQTNLPTIKAWGQQPPAGDWWGTPWEGNIFPTTPGAGIGYVCLYQCNITKRESKLAQYMCWRKPDNSMHWIGLASIQISPQIWPLFNQLFLWLCGDEGYRDKKTSGKTFWSPLCRQLWLSLVKFWVWWPSRSSSSHDTMILHRLGSCSLLFLAWNLQLLCCSAAWEAECFCQGSCSIWDLTLKEEGVLFPWK